MADHRLSGEHVYGNMVLPSKIRDDSIDKIKNLEVADGDVLVASYPKTGSTWMEEIVWLVRNNADTETASKTHHQKRTFLLEHDQLYHDNRSGIDVINDVKRPVIMKTHLPANFLSPAVNSKKVKVIVLIRNPKDTLVSYYHLYRMNSNLGNFNGTWDEFFELFKKKHLVFGDYFDFYESWLPFLDLDNVQLYKYEDMKTDFGRVIHQLQQYLGVDLKADQIQKISDHTAFESMKKNKMVNFEGRVGMKSEISPFIRKGEVGDWKNYFTSEQNRLVDHEYRTRLEKNGILLQFD